MTRFICIDGPDKSGKSTTLQALATKLQARGENVLLTSEPRGTPFGKSITALVALESPRVQLYGMLASREAFHRWLVRNLSGYSVVLIDRGPLSTLAYQASRIGGPEAFELVVDQAQMFWRDFDIQTFVLHPSQEVMKIRMLGQALDPGYESEDIQMHVRKWFASRARVAQALQFMSLSSDPHNAIISVTNETPDQVADRILSCMYLNIAR